MRINYFVPRCTPENSHGRYVIELAKRMGAHHPVTIYSGAFWPPLRSVIQCRFLPVPNRPAVARLAALWVTSFVTARGCPGDIIHVQGADAPVANVVTAQCCTAVMRATKARGSGLHRGMNFAIGAVGEKYCMSKSSTQRVIAVSNKVKEEIEREYGVDPEKVVVVPLGVDPEEFHPRQRARWRATIRSRLALGSDEFVVIFVGGDFRRKGLMELFAAASRLRSFRVLAVGVAPDPALKQLIQDHRLSKNVTFVNTTTEVAPLYAAADCFALLTRYDTFSMSTVEAMATGLPVIVSREAGVSEHLTNDADSIVLSDCLDVEALVQQLQRLIGDPGLRVRLGERARQTAEQFSWNRIAEQTLAVYRQVM